MTALETKPGVDVGDRSDLVVSEDSTKRRTEVQHELEGADLDAVAFLLSREARKNLNRLRPGRTVGATIFNSETPPSPWIVDIIHPYTTILSRKNKDLNDEEIIKISNENVVEVDGQLELLPSSISRTFPTDPLAAPSTAYEAAVRARDVMADLFEKRNSTLDSILAGEHHSGRLLSPRQIEVLSLVAKGMSNKQIAGNLGIAEQTVKNHMTTIRRKTEAHNRIDPAISGFKKGYYSLPTRSDQ